ncbi:MAG: membrane protein insertion efficiency factor YidD [Alphaproteobacteria bacterium]|nr:membrane protein insertion efficiency factor YidD [Alphaproteobacteria bacterium]
MRAPIMRALSTHALRGLIQIYRYGLSPMLPGRCRYLPTCSHYGLEALRVHGPLWGSWLTLRRFLRCHPWGGQGYDPVPSSHHSANPAVLKNR